MFYSSTGIVYLLPLFWLIGAFYSIKVNCSPILLNQIGFNNTINPSSILSSDLARLLFPRDAFRWWFSSQLAPTPYIRQGIYGNENETNSDSVINKTLGRQLGSTLYKNNPEGDMFGDYNGGGGGGGGDDDFFSQIFSFLFGSSGGGNDGGGYYGPSNGRNGGNSNGNINGQGRSDGNGNSGVNSGNFGMTQQEWSQYLQLIQTLAQDGDGGGGGGGFGDAGQLINMAMSMMGGGL